MGSLKGWLKGCPGPFSPRFLSIAFLSPTHFQEMGGAGNPRPQKGKREGNVSLAVLGRSAATQATWEGRNGWLGILGTITQTSSASHPVYTVEGCRTLIINLPVIAS